MRAIHTTVHRLGLVASLFVQMVKHLVQLLLPLFDNTGQPVRRERFEQVRASLVERFGGLTAYSRAPAKGLWKDDMGNTDDTVQDEIVVYEVMLDELDLAWWSRYRQELEIAFGQKELIVRAQEVRLL
jgi:hypothetical protein